MRKFEKVGVVGAGAMGIGIVQVALAAGSKVFMYDTSPDQMQKSIEGLDRQLGRMVEKGKLEEESKKQMLQRLQQVSELSELKSCDLIIEAIVENAQIKKEVFKTLEHEVATSCILASNTSSISITSLSSVLQHPERFVGIHFFNPAPLMPLVEIIPGLLTEPTLADELVETLRSWGKEPVIAKDLPGFIVNRIARPFYGEALRLVEENLATPEEIDFVMKSKGGFRMGPFELMDLIGIDVNFAVTQSVYQDFFYDPKYKPSLLQQRMSEAKRLGRKTGRGFYSYPREESSSTLSLEGSKAEAIFLRILSMLVNEALEAKRLQVASDEDLELAMLRGVNYPKGLLAWGKEIGYKTLHDTLNQLYIRYQEERYRSSPLLQDLAKLH
ncbi:3-hydroxyacyl-CoA dehydrogenase NAD-binding domain-containing protein [Chryseobacterium sp. A301]